ncbi:hypothetical protein Tsubulata_015795 [Turnera subulata]|uniref:Uncharacterized protein n=1 Tax=Turnera subulata TaxID=218843 RepID=A0A9Q0JHC3_9ROSI|nr:hypothetical protein Tsubulata_015795 [Turnera subulata]
MPKQKKKIKHENKNQWNCDGFYNSRDFSGEFSKECKKLRYLAAPTVFTSLCQYSFDAITQVFAGHVVILELASVSVENSVIAGFSFGVMLGMGSVLETLYGQALFPDQQLGLRRSGKSCRLRRMNNLSPSVKHGDFPEQEDDLIIRLHKLLGNRIFVASNAQEISAMNDP